MTESVAVDPAALQRLIQQLTAVTDDIAQLSTTMSLPAFNHPAVAGIDAPGLIAARLRTLGTGLQDVIGNIGRSQAQLLEADSGHAQRFVRPSHLAP